MTSSTPPTQKSGVSGDGRDRVRAEVRKHLFWITRGTLQMAENIRLNTDDDEIDNIFIDLDVQYYHQKYGEDDGSYRTREAEDEIMRLLDAQYNKGLEAAEEHLPDKQPEIDRVQHYCFNAAIDAARQKIRALKRKELP
jgi:hypothetical protein